MKLKFYSDIVNEQERIWYEWDGNQDTVSFTSIKKLLASKGEDDKRIDLVFNCKGGDCIEGWAIYDLLRQQTGCEIHATIEGECSSMASIILLAAPLENRKAYANAHLCIHNPAVCWFDTDYYERLTAENVRKTAEKILNQAESLQTEQDKILATYVERTGTDSETLQALMNQDIYIDMAKAQELGFISGTLAPTTAHKDARFKAYNTNPNINNNQMNKTNAKVTAFNKVVNALKEMVGIEDSPSMKALEVTDVDGNVLTVEREEGDPQVGDAASPDGTFVLEDGTTITVEDGVITAITPAADPEPEEDPEDAKAKKNAKAEGEGEDTDPEEPSVEELQKTIEEQTSTIETLTKQVEELTETVKTLTEQQASAEDKAVLDMVAKAGGKEKVAKALAARSTFNANNTKVVDRSNPAPKAEPLGDTYLEDAKKAHEAAMAKIRK